MLIQPSYEFSPFAYSDTLGATITGWSTKAALANITDVTQYRIVSVGLKIRNISAPLTARGVVRIRGIPTEDNTTLTTVDTSTYNASFAYDIPLQDCHEVVTIPQHSSAMPQIFYPVTGDTNSVTTQQRNGWLPFTVLIEGGPADSTPLDLEIVINYELAFSDGTGLQQLATPAPPANSLITDVAAHLTSTMTPVVKQGAEYMGKQVLRGAIGALAARLAGPNAGRSAYAMIAD